MMGEPMMEFNWTQTGSSVIKIDAVIVQEWREGNPDVPLLDVQQIAQWLEKQANTFGSGWSEELLTNWNEKAPAEFEQGLAWGDLKDEWLTPDEIATLNA